MLSLHGTSLAAVGLVVGAFLRPHCPDCHRQRALTCAGSATNTAFGWQLILFFVLIAACEAFVAALLVRFRANLLCVRGTPVLAEPPSECEISSRARAQIAAVKARGKGWPRLGDGLQ